MNGIEYSGRSYTASGCRARSRVVVCTLSARAYFSQFADCRENAFFHGLSHGIEIQTLNVRSSAISQSRNLCVEHWRKREWAGEPPEFLIFLDDDMVFPDEVITRLVRTATEREADVLGVLATGRVPPFPVCVLDRETLEPLTVPEARRLHEEKAVAEVGAVGMACTLIRTALFETLTQPYFSFCHNLEDVAEMLESAERALDDGRPLDPLILGQAVRGIRERVIGEDYSFCVKAARRGARVLCDFGVETPYQGRLLPGIGHLGAYPFSLSEAIEYARVTDTRVSRAGALSAGNSQRVEPDGSA